MIVTAILAVRNEEAYLANCLRHLVRNQVRFAIIDHQSTDSSPNIYRRREFAQHLVEVRETPFSGAFSLKEQLRLKMEMAAVVKGDWVVHLDADEMMHSYRQGEALCASLERLDLEGFNAVNFDEFVFLPVERDYQSEIQGYPPILTYYFFEPSPLRLMRAWKTSAGLTLAEGGHRLSGPDLKLAPEHLALRHYIVLSQAHARAKYATRVFADEDLAEGWHRQRLGQPAEAFLFPSVALLKTLTHENDIDLDRREPWTQHYWRRSKAGDE